jgi:3-oxoacyl-[acyl-carrier protein] reductase
VARFSGTSAIVTGGAGGIGAATSLLLAREGCAVGVFDLDASGAKAIAGKVNEDPDVLKAGGSALAQECDVTDSDDIESGFESFANECGGLGILVNNAGITRDNLAFKLSNADWDLVLATNLTSAFLCSREAQKYMVPVRRGKIVNLSSRSALGNRGQVNYSAAKAGIQALTATLAIELGPYNINVNAVAPGFIDTPMTAAVAARLGKDVESYRREVAEMTPLRRVGEPRDVAAAIAFLASDDAAYISGQTIYINGGAR